MVGPKNRSIQYDYEESLVLVPECDGVRIISNSYTEFLQLVPDSTVSVFKIGSTSPAAMLYDALDHHERRSAKVRLHFLLLRINDGILLFLVSCFLDVHFQMLA